MAIILPILLPIIAGLLIPLLKLKNRTARCITVFIATAAAFAAVIFAAFNPSEAFTVVKVTNSLSISFFSDEMSVIFAVLISFVWMLTGIHSFTYMKHEKDEDRFYTFFLISLGMMLALCYAQNLITMYLCFEMVTLCSMPLVLHSLKKPAISAALKYLFYSIAGAFLALLGIFVIGSYIGINAFTPGGMLDTALIKNKDLFMAVIFVTVVGFGAKAGLYPLHGWLPAAHPVAPAPASAVLSGIIAKAGVFTIIRVIYYTVGTSFLAGTWVQYTWIILALITVFMGSMMAYREKLLKKRLAFSTVSQISYILLGLFIFSPEGIEGGILHVIFHAFAKTTLFLAAGAIIYSTNKTEVDQLRGIGKRMPVTMWCITIASLTLIGIPPTGGFNSKWYIATASLSSNMPVFSWLIPVILLVSALLTAGYLLPIMLNGFFPGKDFVFDGKRTENTLMCIPMVILSVLCVVLGLFSSQIEAFILKAAQLMF